MSGSWAAATELMPVTSSAREVTVASSAKGFLGVELDVDANEANADRIERKGGKPVLIIPADEEAMIRQLCQRHTAQNCNILTY